MIIFNKYVYHKPNSCLSHRNRVWRNLRKTKAGSLDPAKNLGSDCSCMCSLGTMRLMTFPNISNTRSLPASTESSYVLAIGMSPVWTIQSQYDLLLFQILSPGKTRLLKNPVLSLLSFHHTGYLPFITVFFGTSVERVIWQFALWL